MTKNEIRSGRMFVKIRLELEEIRSIIILILLVISKYKVNFNIKIRRLFISNNIFRGCGVCLYINNNLRILII